MKITATVKKLGEIQCCDRGFYMFPDIPACHNCEHAGKGVEVESSFNDCLSASDDTLITCSLKDTDGTYVYIAKKYLENWDWELESDP